MLPRRGWVLRLVEGRDKHPLSGFCHLTLVRLGEVEALVPPPCSQVCPYPGPCPQALGLPVPVDHACHLIPHCYMVPFFQPSLSPAAHSLPILPVSVSISLPDTPLPHHVNRRPLGAPRLLPVLGGLLLSLPSQNPRTDPLTKPSFLPNFVLEGWIYSHSTLGCSRRQPMWPPLPC